MWVKLDENTSDDAALVAAGAAAGWLLVMSLCYSNRNLTDGFVPRVMVARLLAPDDRPDAAAQRLVDVGVYTVVTRDDGIDGYQIAERFTRNQPSREKVEADRAEARARKERWKARKRGRTPAERKRNAVLRAFGTAVERPRNSPADSDSDSDSERSINRERSTSGARWFFRGKKLKLTHKQAEFVIGPLGKAAEALDVKALCASRDAVLVATGESFDDLEELKEMCRQAIGWKPRRADNAPASSAPAWGPDGTRTSRTCRCGEVLEGRVAGGQPVYPSCSKCAVETARRRA